MKLLTLMSVLEGHAGSHIEGEGKYMFEMTLNMGISNKG